MGIRIKGYQSVVLPDGRELGVSDSGPTDGRAIFFFPGFAVSARAAHPDSTIAESIGVRLVAIDRPGIGKSSRQSKRTLLDWPRDVAALADKLGIDRFGILGWSGGGPHALACSIMIPERLPVVGLFSCAPSFSDDWPVIAAMPAEAKRLSLLAKYATAVLRIGFWNHCRRIRKNADALFRETARDLSPGDREIIFDAQFYASLKLSMIQACDQGPQGLTDDVLAIARPWGFNLNEVRGPVHLWHSEQDTTIPVEIGHYIARAIPNCTATFIPGGGHFSYLTHWREILLRLAAY